MHILNLEEFCSVDAYPALILYTLLYAQKGFTITHTLTFNSVYWYMHQYVYVYCIAFVLASVLVLVSIYMSVFESLPCHYIRMDQDQTYSIGSPDLRKDALDDMLCRIHLHIGSPDLRKDALDDMLCRIHLQSDDPDIWNKRLKETNCDNDLIRLYMPWKIQLVFREELVSTLFLMYIHTAQVPQQVSYVNQPQMSTISLIFKTSMFQHHPSGRIMKIFLRTSKSSREVACAFLMALWHTLPMVRSKQTCF